MLRPWRVYEVTCPDCGRVYNSPCVSPAGPHLSRVELAKEFARLRKPLPRK
ncbi:zinc finger domain-containing protein [Streptomyces lutosisoli]